MARASFVGTRGKRLSATSYVLPISVGQAYHEGEQLEAIIELINRRNFQKGRIVIASTLQRHTLGLLHQHLAKDEVRTFAHEKGVQWQKRNMSTLNKLNHFFDIVDWSSFLTTKAYADRKNELMTLYDEDTLFREKIDETVNNFINRWLLRKLIIEADMDLARVACKEYVLEECSVMSTWAGGGFQYEIYPSANSLAMETTRKLFVLPNYPNELIRLRVNIRGTSKPKLQRNTLPGFA
jgi:tRNA-dependent cyclodipeptide synthase